MRKSIWRLGPLALGALGGPLLALACRGEDLAIGTTDTSGSTLSTTAAWTTSAANSAKSTHGPCSTIEVQSMVIRERSCAICHGGQASSSSFDYVLDDARLKSTYSKAYVEPDGGRLRMVVPGDPVGSWIYERFAQMVQGEHAEMHDMAVGLGPDAGLEVVWPTTADESIMYEWVLECLGVDGRGLPDASYCASFDGATMPVPVGDEDGGEDGD